LVNKLCSNDRLKGRKGGCTTSGTRIKLKALAPGVRPSKPPVCPITNDIKMPFFRYLPAKKKNGANMFVYTPDLESIAWAYLSDY
jgi:hypothetical protein